MNAPPIHRLGDLVEVRGGKRLPSGATYVGHPTRHPYIRVVDVEHSSIRRDRLEYISDSTHRQIARYTISSEDVFISIAGSIGLVATIPDDLSGANLTENAAKLVIKDRARVDRDYLARFLASAGQTEIQRRTFATGQPKLALFRIEEIPIPLPPLSSQRRIADILDKTETARRKRREVIALTEQLQRSAFLDMFGDPVRNPRGWEVRPLGELTELIDYGVTASASPLPVGPKFLRITDIQDNRVDWNDVPYCECDATTAVRAGLAPGDIVFARTGATTGKSFLIRDCPAGTVFASYLIRVRPVQRLASGYLSEFFQSAGYWAQIRSMAEGAAQPGVNASKLSGLNVPVPPIERQQEFDAVLAKVTSLQAANEVAQREVGNLFDSLVHRAFRGDLAIDGAGKPRLPAA